MIPMTLVFKKMKMTAMDAIKKLDKNIKLEIKGENTEIDRSIVGKLLEPLTHIIRNSIDHLNYILKEYYHDTKSFKDGQKEHLSN